MTAELYSQGIQNVADALFVRDHFVKIALELERWNIVVYEAHRATELLVRGMICQLGCKPKEHHDIRRHLMYLLDHLPGARHSVIPFTIGAHIPSGDRYGAIIEADSIQIYALHGGVYCVLAVGGAELPMMGHAEFVLEVNGSQVSLLCNGVHLLSASDVSLSGPYTVIDKSFVRQPEKTRLKLLTEFGDRLSSKRDIAYYGEKSYAKDDALHAIHYMKESFKAAEAFFAFQ